MATRRVPLSQPLLDGNEKKYVVECIESSWISSHGRFIDLFERSFAAFCGAGYAVACNNGTTALHAALLAMGVEPGDEVIVPTLTYVATANAVRYCGATPVFADSEPETMNLDPNLIEDLVSPRTKGILPVHLYGHPVDMDPVLEIARRRNLFVLEDAAEAHGSTYRSRSVGGLGDAAAFSFFGNKILTTGEGGMVTTSDRALHDRVRVFRGQGMDPDRRYWFPIVGYNYRMTNVAAAIGLAQLEQAERHLDAHRRTAAWYHRHLDDLQDLLTLPVELDWAHHAYWLYTIRLRDSAGVDRDEAMSRLGAAGIETRPVFYPMHQLPPYREQDGRYPVAEKIAASGISLPVHGCMTEEDVAYIASHLRSICSA
jgi:perosamine synthetase